MRHRIARVLSVMCAFALLFAGCSSQAKGTAGLDGGEGVERTFAQVYRVRFSQMYSDYASRGVFATSETENGQEEDGTPYVHKLYADFMPYESLDLIQELEIEDDELDQVARAEKLEAVYASLRAVFVITVYEKAQVPDQTDLAAHTGFAENTLLGDWDGYLCVASTPDRDESGLQQESLDVYRALCEGVPGIFDSVIAAQ